MSPALLAVLLTANVSGPELERCRLGSVVFTRESTGWAVDACGGMFVTRNGGASWSKDEAATALAKAAHAFATLSFGAALADGTLLVGGSIGGRVLRSESGGRVWSSVPLPDDQLVYSVSHAGPNVWLCGSSGSVVRSHDSGKTWSKAPKSPTDDRDRCISLSFLDGERGWVAGWYGHLYATANGGETWTSLPLPPPFKQEGAHPRTVDQVLLLDERVGFVAGAPGTFRTADGGRTWQRIEIPHEAAARVVAVGERRVLVSERSAKLAMAQWEPRLDEHLVARGDEAVRLERDRLIYYRQGKHEHVGWLTGPPSGELPRPESIRELGSGKKSAFGTHRVFLSDDDGVSWLERAPLPGNRELEDFVVLNDRDAIARARGGALFVSDSAARRWEPSRNPALDEFDLRRQKGLPAPVPSRCLEKAAAGSAVVQFGTQGCFGGNTSGLRLEWSPVGGSLSSQLDPLLEKHSQPIGKLSREEARRRVDELNALVKRPEVPSQCTSTSHYEIELEISCTLGAAPVSERLKLSSYDCNAEDDAVPAGVGGATISGGSVGGYARAIGVHNWASRLAAP